MPTSMLPERPLVISPTLAATIGLEEAVMLQGLADLLEHRQSESRAVEPSLQWKRVDESLLRGCFPFWHSADIKRVQNKLLSLGLIAIDADAGDDYYLAIIDSSAPSDELPRAGQLAANQETVTGATILPSYWQPDETCLRLCEQQSIPRQFALEQVPEFVSYWRARGQARFAWGNVFYKHVVKEWRGEQTRRGARELASAMSADWYPSEDAIGILENAGVSPDFIEDAIPEFVLYWRERGVEQGAWNTKFIEHIRRQWAKYSASFGQDTTPRLITDDWQPSAECYEILQLAEIDEDYARNKVPEFVMYWRECKQVKSSWNTTFLQFIKQDWARKLKLLEHAKLSHAEDQSPAGSNQQKIRERFQQIADRSWAE